MSYDEIASEFAVFYNAREPHLAKALGALLSQGSRVLDLGCGSGRDLSCLQSMGFEVLGVEPSKGMRDQAEAVFPSLKGHILDAALPRIILDPELKPFNGILCNAVLQHLKPGDLIPALARLKALTLSGGFVIISIPLCYPLDDTGYDEHGRFFNLQPREFWQDLAIRFGFELLGSEVKNDDRPDRTWLVLTLRRPEYSGLRPLEVVASVIGQDAKTTTYKFALVRAIAELALSGANCYRWEAGWVRVPLEAVSLLWLSYYYPLVNSPNFIPQGRISPGKMDIKFRTALKKLGVRFESCGGWFALHRECSKPNLDPQIVEVLRNIQDALVKGPITYAGNKATQGKLFKVDQGDLMIPATLWSEMGRFSPWIRDAVILRWAEFTRDLGNSGTPLRTGDILDRLLPEDFVRTQQYYKNLMAEALHENPVSLWSGNPLGNNFHIDHIIPFSLWGNNDLWNLVPVSATENINKSDKLPTLELLYSVKDRLNNHWSFLARARNDQFRGEVTRTLGLKIDNWTPETMNGLFDALMASVELTSQLVGSERWTVN